MYEVGHFLEEGKGKKLIHAKSDDGTDFVTTTPRGELQMKITACDWSQSKSSDYK